MTQLELKNKLEELGLDNFDHGFCGSKLNENYFKIKYEEHDSGISKVYIPTSILTHIINCIYDYETNLWDKGFSDGKHDATEVGDLYENIHDIMIDNGITEFCLSEKALEKCGKEKYDEFIKTSEYKHDGNCKMILVDTNNINEAKQ